MLSFIINLLSSKVFLLKQIVNMFLVKFIDNIDNMLSFTTNMLTLVNNMLTLVNNMLTLVNNMLTFVKLPQ